MGVYGEPEIQAEGLMTGGDCQEADVWLDQQLADTPWWRIIRRDNLWQMKVAVMNRALRL